MPAPKRSPSDLFAHFEAAESNQEGRAFVQSRIALFMKVMFWSYLVLLVFINAMYEIHPMTRPARATLINYLAGAGMTLFGFAWVAASRSRVRSANVLLGLDIAAVVIIAAAFASSGILSSDRQANVYSAFIWMSFTIFARSLIIPSTGLRSVVLSVIGMAPMVGMAAVVRMPTPTPALVAGAVIFVVVVTVLSAIGSHVIYGLRTQVREAMQLGQYTLEEKIGEGGMGAVYTASHAMLRRPTAIKLLRPERTGSDALRRFQREVQITSELTHPNTVAIYDYGRSPDGQFYYVMEFLSGVDLETLVRLSGPQPHARVTNILGQVCGSLEEAHERGLVHRDIKPGNIMLCNRGGIPDVVKVLDFGLARKLDKNARLTQGDMVAGTPAYLAPEAVTDPDEVGAMADLYALGAVGYFLLTGKTVFEATSAIEMCMHHVDSEPEPLSSRVDAEVPEELEALIMQCLAKAPDDRPQSARALRMSLAKIATEHPWTEERAARAWAAFEEEHQDSLHPRGPSSVPTMTVDLAARRSGGRADSTTRS